MTKRLTSLTSANLRPKRNYDRVVEREQRDDDPKKMKSQKRGEGENKQQTCMRAIGKAIVKGQACGCDRRIIR
jgi:hypothetical protein